MKSLIFNSRESRAGLAAQIGKNKFQAGVSVPLHEPVLKMANESLGSRRMLFGADCPFWGLGEGLDSMRNLNLSEEDQKKIFHRKVEAILKLS